MPSVRRLYRLQRKHKQSRTPGTALPTSSSHPISLSLLFNFFLFPFQNVYSKAVGISLEGYPDNLLTPGSFIRKQAMLCRTHGQPRAKACRSGSASVAMRVTYRHSYTGCATRCSQDFFLCETRYSVLPTRWKPAPGHKNQPDYEQKLKALLCLSSWEMTHCMWWLLSWQPVLNPLAPCR